MLGELGFENTVVHDKRNGVLSRRYKKLSLPLFQSESTKKR
jgi:hypothetical protein